MWAGTIVAITLCKENRRKAGLMKINTLFLSALCLIGTTLLARVAIHGIEQALLATAADYGLNRIGAGGKLLAPNID
jgi:hypothetical protein